MTRDDKQVDVRKPKANVGNSRRYDLEGRTLEFAQDVVRFINRIPKSLTNVEIGKQLVRAAGSVGANYIEANECLGKKDFLMRIRICRKEAKETKYWLKLFDGDGAQFQERDGLLQEAGELERIFGAILRKSEARDA